MKTPKISNQNAKHKQTQTTPTSQYSLCDTNLQNQEKLQKLEEQHQQGKMEKKICIINWQQQEQQYFTCCRRNFSGKFQ